MMNWMNRIMAYIITYSYSIVLQLYLSNLWVNVILNLTIVKQTIKRGIRREHEIRIDGNHMRLNVAKKCVGTIWIYFSQSLS